MQQPPGDFCSGWLFGWTIVIGEAMVVPARAVPPMRAGFPMRAARHDYSDGVQKLGEQFHGDENTCCASMTIYQHGFVPGPFLYCTLRQ